MNDVTTKRADAIHEDDTLADGAIVLHTSMQLEWIYVQAVKGGRIVRRRYRHDKLVPIIAP